MADLFKSTALQRNAKGAAKPATAEELRGKIVGLFFAAKWNQSCVDFMEMLNWWYENANEKSKEFEIVFISRDHSESDMKAFLGQHGPWLFTKYADKTVNALFNKYQLKAIPQLMIVQKGGTPLVDDAIDTINDTKTPPAATLAKWKKLTTE